VTTRVGGPDEPIRVAKATRTRRAIRTATLLPKPASEAYDRASQRIRANQRIGAEKRIGAEQGETAFREYSESVVPRNVNPQKLVRLRVPHPLAHIRPRLSQPASGVERNETMHPRTQFRTPHAAATVRRSTVTPPHTSTATRTYAQAADRHAVLTQPRDQRLTADTSQSCHPWLIIRTHPSETSSRLLIPPSNLC